MNEQFSRLYHLAWDYAQSDPEYQANPTYERRCVVQSRIFAELIAGECAELAGCNGHVTGFDLGDLIYRHFGIEK